MSDQLKLHGLWTCAFASRVHSALLHKGVPFQYIEQDPYDKSPEWLAINPRGLVPVIVHDGKTVYDSPICVEYVDEAFKGHGPSLMPSDAFERAHVRMWSDHVTKKIVPFYYQLLIKQNKEEHEKAMLAILEAVALIQNAMDEKGPFFMGNDFGLVDIMLWPFALRLEVVTKHYRAFSVPRAAPFQRYHRWCDSVLALDAVKHSIPDKDKLIEVSRKHVESSAQSETAKAIRKGEAMP